MGYGCFRRDGCEGMEPEGLVILPGSLHVRSLSLENVGRLRLAVLWLADGESICLLPLATSRRYACVRDGEL